MRSLSILHLILASHILQLLLIYLWLEVTRPWHLMVEVEVEVELVGATPIEAMVGMWIGENRRKVMLPRVRKRVRLLHVLV